MIREHVTGANRKSVDILGQKERIIDISDHTSKIKRKNREYLDKIPMVDIIAIIDETNNPGSRKDGKQYILGATVVDADRIKEFSDITEMWYRGRELKFREQPRLRDDVLNEMAKLNPRIYAVTVEIPPDDQKWNDEEQADVHQYALSLLIERMSAKEKVDSIHIIVDENNKAKQGKMDEIRDKAIEKNKKSITVDIRRSGETFPLQTNDFTLGAMGKMYNRNMGEYIKRIPRPDRITMIFERVIGQNKEG